MARLPFFTSSARANPGQAVLARAAGVNTLAQAGEALGAFAEKQKRLQDMRESADAANELADLKLSWAQKAIGLKESPDAGAVGFADKVQAEYDQDVAARLKRFSPEAQGYLRERATNFKAILSTDLLALEADARGRQVGDTIQSSINKQINAVRSNPALLPSALEEMASTIGAAPVPVAYRQKWATEARGQIATAHVSAIIDRNPDAAVKALASGQYDAYLSPEKKNALMNEADRESYSRTTRAIALADRADRDAAKRLKQESDAAQKDFMVKAMTGELTVSDVLKKQHVLQPEALSSSLRMAREGDGVTDKEVDADLTSRVGREDISKDALKAHARGALSGPRLHALLSANEQVQRDARPGAPFKTLRANIDGRLKSSELNFTPAQAALQQDGLREWDDWNRANPAADKDQMDNKADEIIRRYSQIQVGEMLAATPLPRHYNKDRDAIRQRPQEALEALNAAAQKLAEDLNAKRIPETQAAREYRDIQVLEDAARKALASQRDRTDKSK